MQFLKVFILVNELYKWQFPAITFQENLYLPKKTTFIVVETW